jgi:predicted HTH transcriptional regulator
MSLQIINDDETTVYSNGVELLFKQIPDGKHGDRLFSLTEQINSIRKQEQKLSEQRARLLKYTVENKKLSVIKCSKILQVSRQRVYKIIDSLNNKLEEE